MAVTNVAELNALVERVKQAQREYANFTQEQVDTIFGAADARIPLVKKAVAESGMGIVEDKVIKNHFALEYIYNAYKDKKPVVCLHRRHFRHYHYHYRRADWPDLRYRADHQPHFHRDF